MPTYGPMYVSAAAAVERAAAGSAPVVPPPPPSAAPRMAVAAATSRPPAAEPTEPAPWWRPLALLLALPLVLLGCGRLCGEFSGRIRPGPAGGGELAASPDGLPPAEEMPEPESPPEPAILLPEGSGEVHFTAATATLSGTVEVRNLTEEVLANWTSPEDAAEWQFRLAAPGFFQIELVYATSPQATAGGDLEVAIGKQREAMRAAADRQPR